MNARLRTYVTHARNAAGLAWCAKQCGDDARQYQAECRYWIDRARHVLQDMKRKRLHGASNVYSMAAYRNNRSKHA